MEAHRTGETGPVTRRTEAGAALVMGCFLGVLAVGLTVSGAFLMQANRAELDSGFILAGQSQRFARSGITETLNWLRRQPAQPVLAFDPSPVTMASSSFGETDDPAIGLVRDFQIDGIYWGRYEVWKPWDADPDPERREWRRKMEVEDTSARHRLPAGSAWRIRCIGYVYRRSDPDRAFNRLRNEVLGSQAVEVEVLRVGVELPGAMVDGAPLPLGGYDGGLEPIFGTDGDGLRALAEVLVTDAGSFPSPIPTNGFVFSEVGSMALGENRPLSGFGLVVHRGDLRLESGSGSGFRGLLYVDGDLEIAAPIDLAGAVIVTGKVTVVGDSDPAKLRYDAHALETLKEVFGQYRFVPPVRQLPSGK